ncbi:MAG: GntR family transcriptional regulator [Bacillus sp. (in: firmicutes)]|jgi:GntR family transcriptional regulator|uniref:GntR family transcriptional regulator n=1 Tax=Bacillus sp. 1NLA3E TaxID=666686 RepID=UPI000247F466|nr:GntR family transcriptional regulator [Bacillus sp. 1NLA3E]AGK53786.1 GntR family transcriptional regulator [Bacillus sp. 1NLA3E]MDF2903067.1 GntR family transcriptional regulator [Bacillus sp. (in: firmicutes)]
MDIIILNTSEKPIYQQIKEQIIKHVLIGQLSEGEQLPSIRNLAKELKISVITTKRAYEELENEGYIDTVLGKGSFVSIGKKQILRQKQLDSIRNQLKQIVHESKKYDITTHQLIQLIEQFYEED